MNKERRKQIANNNSQVNYIIDMLNQYKNKIESIQMDEEFAFDSLPEGFQEGIRGQDMQDAIDTMESVIDKIDSVIIIINEVKNDLMSL